MENYHALDKLFMKKAKSSIFQGKFSFLRFKNFSHTSAQKFPQIKYLEFLTKKLSGFSSTRNIIVDIIVHNKKIILAINKVIPTFVLSSKISKQ